ncbi:MAG: PEP-CTERM sorting domain-containing protein, partial [Verrucomicrobiota bacterium]
IDSFFDVFTELSLDGGATWMPDTSGPMHVNLVETPEPSVCALAGLAAGLLAWRRKQWFAKQQ